jgi:hypothetical protein
MQLSTALMLEHGLGRVDDAQRLRAAVWKTYRRIRRTTSRARRPLPSSATPSSESCRSEARRMRGLVSRDLVLVLQGAGDVVEALEQALALEWIELEAERASPLRLEVDRDLTGSSISAFTCSCGRTTGTSPILTQFVRKMSPNDGATIASKPQSWSAQGACSRDEPQPKLRPARRNLRALRLGPVELEAGLLRPVVEEELSEARAFDALEELLRDDLVRVDVGRSSTAAREVTERNGLTRRAPARTRGCPRSGLRSRSRQPWPG